ncbi:MAG TPA: Crp/Fnr family transcriptional regulator [Anaerolineaceae bacterium]|nr:Crp/Fnr family transcriptional regulator [Anaerolineaceae bacterium]
MTTMRSVHGKGIDPERLRAIPLFAGLSPQALDDIAASGIARKVSEAGFFFMQGDPGEDLFLLTQGRTRITQVTPDGQQVILHVVNPWEVFGLIALTEGGNFPASAQAMDESQAITWDRETLRALVEKHPRLAMNAMNIMSGRLHEFQDRIRELSTEKVERRLARALLRLVRQSGRKEGPGVVIDLPVTRQDLAEMTGTTQFTVSRILSRWERDGLIDAGRERVLIRFPHGLVRIAEDVPGAEEDSQ